MSRRPRERGQPKVLVIDDEPDLLELLELTLSRMGLDTTRAQSVAEAIRLLDAQAFDLCLTDMRLPDGEGLRVVEHITEKGLDVPVADLFTAFQNAAAHADGHICHAGLLNSLPQNQFLCDIHPSQSGHALIAHTIEQTLATMRGGTR